MIDIKIQSNYQELDRLSKSAIGADTNINKIKTDVTKLNTTLKESTDSIRATVAGLVSFNVAKDVITDVTKTFAEMQNQLLDIQKTTGLAGADLDELTSSLRELSITTAGMEIGGLNEIASIAGQLGIKGKENILAFTEEIKKLTVTSDLSAQEAGNAFAQLSNALNEPIQNINKLSSTFTALASSTTASEKTLIDYVQRLSGAGTTLDLTTAQIAGLGATLKDVGLSAELSTTAMSTVLTKLMTDTKKITDVMSLDFKEFSDLVQNDANQALLVFLESLGKLDKQARLKALDELKMSGAGLSSTLLKLSSNTEKLIQNQLTANQAYQDGTATQQEFDIASQSLTSHYQQLTSATKAMSYELGSVLEPSMSVGIDLLTDMANYVRENSDQVIQLTKVLGGAVIAWKTLNLVMSASPFGRVVAGLTAIIGVALKAKVAIENVFEAQARANEAQAKLASGNYSLDGNGQVITAQQKNIQIYNDIVGREKELQQAIRNTSRLIEDKNKLTASQRAILEENLKKQSQELNNIKLQRGELEKYYDYLKSTPKETNTKITIDAKSATNELKKVNDTIDKIKVPKITIPKIDAPKIPKIKAPKIDAPVVPSPDLSRFEDAFNRATLNQYELQRINLDKQLKEFDKYIIDKDRLNQWYSAELSKINDQEERDNQAKLQRELDEQKRHAEEIARINQQFQDDFDRSFLSSFDLERKQLKKRYDDYKKNVTDKVKLDKWYANELKKITDKENEDILRREEERFKEEYRLVEQELQRQQKLYEEHLQKVSGAVGIFTSGIGDAFNMDLSGINDSLSEVITKGIDQGFANVDFSQFGMDLGTVAVQSLSSSLMNDLPNTTAVSVGSSIGGAIGSYLGGGIGEAIGEYLGGGLGDALFGGNKYEEIFIRNTGNLVSRTHTTGGLFRSSSNSYNDATSLALTRQVDQAFTTVDRLFSQLGNSIDLGMTDIYDYQQSLYAQNEDFFNKDHAQWTSLELDPDELTETLDNTLLQVWSELVAKSGDTLEESIRNLNNFEEVADAWRLYAESVDSTVIDTLTQSLGDLNRTSDEIFRYVNKDNQEAILERDIDMLSKYRTQLEESLGISGITLDNFDETVQNLIETGRLTPEMSANLNDLGQVLIDDAKLTEQLNELRSQEADSVDEVKDSVEQLSTASIDLMKQVYATSDSINNKFITALDKSGAVAGQAWVDPKAFATMSQGEISRAYDRAYQLTDWNDIQDVIKLAQVTNEATVKREDEYLKRLENVDTSTAKTVEALEVQIGLLKDIEKNQYLG